MTKYEETLTTVLAKERKHTKIIKRSYTVEYCASLVEEYFCEHSFKKIVFQMFPYLITVVVLNWVLNVFGYFTFGTFIILLLAVFTFYATMPLFLLSVLDRGIRKLSDKIQTSILDDEENTLVSLYYFSADSSVEHLWPEISNVLPKAARIVEAYRIIGRHSQKDSPIHVPQEILILNNSVKKFLLFVRQEKEDKENRIKSSEVAKQKKNVELELEATIFPHDISEVEDALILAETFKRYRKDFI